MKRSLVRGLARGLAGVLFLAQMTIAAYACPGLSSAIAAAAPIGPMQPMTQRSAAAAPMPDCGGMAGMLDPAAANLCAEHCKYGQQSDHASTLTVPAVILNALYTTTPVVPPTPLPRRVAALTGAMLAASPPHAILHCVWRI